MRYFRLSFIVIAMTLVSTSAFAQALKSTAPKMSDRVPNAVRTVTITSGDDMKYSITRITAKRGETIRIKLTSTGTVPKIAMAHNAVILKPGTNVAKFVEAGAMFRAEDFINPALKASVLAQTKFAVPGETVELIFKVPAAAAIYPFVCTFPGHLSAGMTGTIVVK